MSLARQEAAPTEGVAVPFRMLPSNHMVVEAKVNGKGPYRFIFDLGAPVTLLTNRVAEAAGAIKPGTPPAFLLGARGEGADVELKFGDLTAAGVPTVVMDHPYLKLLRGPFDRPLDGIIGYTFWARYRTTIDYQARQLTFVPVEFEVRNLMKDLPARMEEMMKRRGARTVILAPRGLWGLTVAEPEGGVAASGVPIRSVAADSPAAAAGLRPGDVLTSLDGRWTASVADVYAAAAGVEPGRSVPVGVLRDGEERTISVTPRDGI